MTLNKHTKDKINNQTSCNAIAQLELGLDNGFALDRTLGSQLIENE